MSSFAIILRAKGRLAEPAEIDALLAPVAYLGPQGRTRWIRDDIGIGALLFSVAPEADRERQPVLSRDERWVLAADVRLDNREELIRDLGDAPEQGTRSTDTELLLAAWLRWRERCRDRLVGDFAFCVYDRRERSLWAAADPLGVRRLFYAEPQPHRFVIGSEEAMLLALPELSLDWDELAVAGWLLGRPHRERSLRKGIAVLACGRTLQRSLGRHRVSSPWTPAGEAEIRYRRVEEYAEHYREILRAAVRTRMRSQTGSVASELSGGLDSGSVTALLHRAGIAAGIAVLAISRRFPGFPAADEGAYIDEVVRTTGVDHSAFDAGELFARGYPLGFLPRTECIAALDDPMQRETLRRARARGADVLLTGLGGDELLHGGPAAVYAERLLSGDLSVVSELVRAARPLDLPMPSLLRRRLLFPILKKILGPLMDLRCRWRKASGLPPWIEADPAMRRRISAAYLSPVRVGFRYNSRQEAWNLLSGHGSLLAVDGYRMEGIRAGVDVRHPFYDVRLCRFVYAVPPALLHRQGLSKWLGRFAAAGILPDSLRWRTRYPDFEALCASAWNAHRERISAVFARLPEGAVPLLRTSPILSAYRAEAAAGSSTALQALFALMLVSWATGRTIVQPKIEATMRQGDKQAESNGRSVAPAQTYRKPTLRRLGTLAGLTHGGSPSRRDIPANRAGNKLG